MKAARSPAACQAVEAFLLHVDRRLASLRISVDARRQA